MHVEAFMCRNKLLKAYEIATTTRGRLGDTGNPRCALGSVTKQNMLHVA